MGKHFGRGVAKNFERGLGKTRCTGGAGEPSHLMNHVGALPEPMPLDDIFMTVIMRYMYLRFPVEVPYTPVRN